MRDRKFRGIWLAFLLIAATCGHPAPAWAANLQEVAPPAIISQLAPAASGTPQIYITSPRSEEILPSGNVSISLQVAGTNIFKNATFGIGPHLHLLLDGTPSGSIYDLSQPIALPNLTPGSHTLQVFAAKPWHESWKNPGALAQVTFHVLAKSLESLSSSAPRLVFSPPNNFGAEPFLLDFDLTNPPSHPDPRQPQQVINDWQVRATINNQSFLVDRWEPIYLKGMNPGANLIKLEYLDKTGQILDSSIRVVNYQPNGQDSFSRLLRNEVPLANALALFDPNSRAVAIAPAPAQNPPSAAPVPSATPLPAMPTVTAPPLAMPPSMRIAPVTPPPAVAIAPPVVPPAPAVPVLPVPVQSIAPAPVTPIPTPTPVAMPVSPVVPIREYPSYGIAPPAIATAPSPLPVAPPLPKVAQPTVVPPTPAISAPLPSPATPTAIERPQPTPSVPPVASPLPKAIASNPIATAPRSLTPQGGEDVVEFKVILRELFHTLGVRIKQATNQIPPLVAQWSQNFSHWVSARMQVMRSPQPAPDSTASPV